MKRSFAQINAYPSSDAEDPPRDRSRDAEPEHIQFFGSANTQTQNHAYNNDPLSVPEFQKENIQSTLLKSQSLHGPISPASPPLRDPANALRPHCSLDLSLPTSTSIVQQQAHATQDIAVPSDIKQVAMSGQKPPSSPSQPAQDSFGDPMPLDPAQALLASDAFQKPISQLGRSTDDENNTIPFSRSPTPIAPAKDYVRSSPLHSPLSKRSHVASHATPAPLTDDDHTTEGEQETQRVASQSMSSPSSSYARYIDGRGDSPPPGEEETVATQTDLPSACDPVEDSTEDPFAKYGLSTSTGITDRFHIRFYQQVAGESQSQEDEIKTQPTGAVDSNNGDDGDEVATQPAYEPKEGVDPAPAPAQNTKPVPPPADVHIARKITFPNAPSRPAPAEPTSQDTDAMDIVPDSEPPRQDVRSSPVRTPPRTPAKRPTSSTSAPKKTPKQTPHKFEKEAEIVPDSVVGADDTATENGEEESVAQALAAKSIEELRQEEEEEDSDDVPLALQAVRASTFVVPPQPISKETPKGPRRIKSEPKPASKTRKGKHAPSDDIVPSSAPDQDKAKSAAIGKGKGKQPAKSERDSRSSSVTSNVTHRPRRVSMDTEARGKYYESPESDIGTGSEDDEEELDLAPSTSKKRKRSAVVTATKVKSESKIAKRPSKMPSRKRTRLADSGTPTDCGTRVIALWKESNQYYTGYVYSREEDGLYQIRFDDGERATVSLEHMRLLEFHQGDEVRCGKSQGTVVGVEEVETKKVISLNLKRGTTDVGLEKVSIACKAVATAWQDRLLNEDDIVPALQPLGPRVVASPSKQSLVNSNPSGIFAQDAFILTANGDGGKDKAANIIKRHGGTIFEHWCDILALAGSYRNGNKNWHIESKNIYCKLNPGGKAKVYSRLFLIAADVKLTPKYMMALTLGVPCISEEWIHESVRTDGNAPWNSYLLPQGRCESLQVTVSQRIDINWCDSTHHIQQLWANNPLRSTVFEGESVLLLGKFIPPTKQNDMHPHTYVPCIVACMGAEYVEAAENLSTVSRKPSAFGYVVIREKSEYKSHKNALSTARRVITVGWVKDSLVMGRAMPLEQLDA